MGCASNTGLTNINSNLDGVKFYSLTQLSTATNNITIPNSSRFMIFVGGSASNRQAIYGLYSNASGTVGVELITSNTPGGLTITSSTNKITITSTVTYSIVIMSLNGADLHS